MLLNGWNDWWMPITAWCHCKIMDSRHTWQTNQVYFHKYLHHSSVVDTITKGCLTTVENKNGWKLDPSYFMTKHSRRRTLTPRIKVVQFFTLLTFDTTRGRPVLHSCLAYYNVFLLARFFYNKNSKRLTVCGFPFFLFCGNNLYLNDEMQSHETHDWNTWARSNWIPP